MSWQSLPCLLALLACAATGRVAQGAPTPADVPASAASSVVAGAASSAASDPASDAAATPPQAPTLDIEALETRLKDTPAIGVFTKLALKNQVDDLLERFRAVHQGRTRSSLAELRRPFNMLVTKVLVLLQDDDPPLAQAIAASREPLWKLLSDPEQLNRSTRPEGGTS